MDLTAATPTVHDRPMETNITSYKDYPTDNMIQEVWDIVDESVPLLWEDARLRNDRYLHSAISRVLLSRHPEWVEEGVTTKILTPRIARWLRDPLEYSPYVDMVAVERAVDLDYSVVPALTARERREVGRRLAEMEEPWGDRLGDMGGWPGQDSRRVRWRALSVPQQNAFRNMMLAVRKADERAANNE